MERELSDGLIAIRPLRLEDAAAHLAGEDAETVRWLSGGVSDIAGTRSWIERSTRHWRDGGPTFVFGIWQVSPRTLVGMIEANTDHRQLDAVPEDGANISYGLHSQARGRGYMPRALALLESFLRDLGVGVAVIRVDPENDASLRVPGRSGFVFQRDDRKQPRRPVGHLAQAARPAPCVSLARLGQSAACVKSRSAAAGWRDSRFEER